MLHLARDTVVVRVQDHVYLPRLRTPFTAAQRGLRETRDCCGVRLGKALINRHKGRSSFRDNISDSSSVIWREPNRHPLPQSKAMVPAGQVGRNCKHYSNVATWPPGGPRTRGACSWDRACAAHPTTSTHSRRQPPRPPFPSSSPRLAKQLGHIRRGHKVALCPKHVGPRGVVSRHWIG